MKLDTPLNQFRLIALMEGISYLLFAITMPLKYVYSIPGPNFVVGMIHGLLFMLYIVLAIRCVFFYNWKFGFSVAVFMASLIPFGTFYMDAKYLKHQKSNS